MKLIRKIKQMQTPNKFYLAMAGIACALGITSVLCESRIYQYKGFIDGYKVSIEKIVNFDQIRNYSEVRIENIMNNKTEPYSALGIDYDDDERLDEIRMSSIHGDLFKWDKVFKLDKSGELIYSLEDKKYFTFADVYKTQLVMEEAIKSIMNKEHRVKIKRQ